MLPTLLVVLLSSLLVSAQFGGFFNNMFGGGRSDQHADHGHHQRQQQSNAGPASQWVSYAENTPCSQYLCPSTLVCVPSPVDCPCPNIEDVRCIIPDEQEPAGTVVCVRGKKECAFLDLLTKF
ncbi:hypothetical protein BOTBODRAFT_118839 [Botryobasidium botryosum FD-172 SS1]|uniref:Long chronological lifespan protein 2 n=1 Tax=Botryobasidium botryosum (strain FD-172 SS1) TaxID=930990 RepID=A0A067M8W5_BOTB1|nr:hypothetical protein BOTBODRAFT_118839 [Botryobasidium botryosum FD-172 SS1]